MENEEKKIGSNDVIEKFIEIGIGTSLLHKNLIDEIKKGNYAIDSSNDIMIFINGIRYWITTKIEVIEWKRNGKVILGIRYNIEKDSKYSDVIETFVRF